METQSIIQVQVKDKVFVPYLSSDSIKERVEEMGALLSEEYEGKDPVFLGILNGSFVFLSDLLRASSLKSEIRFMQCSSYVGTKSSGEIQISVHFDIEELRARHIIIVEDIVDTGTTLDKLISLLETKGCKSIKTICLLFKPEAFSGAKEPELVGFRIPNDFVVGYGLDYDGYGRELIEIMVISE